MKKTVSLILLLLITFSSFSQDTPAIIKTDRIETEDGVKYYVHTVARGQTLYSIAKVYEVTVGKIIEINPDAKLGLRIGQELWIPFPDTTEETTEKTSEQENFVYHIVKKGETLYGVSKIYQVEIEKIKEANPEISDEIKEGSYLKIPLSTDYPEKIAEKSYEIGGMQSTKDVGKVQNATNHTVETQETLYSISRKYNVSIEGIKAINPGLSENLSVGQVIKIPLGASENVPDMPVTPVEAEIETQGQSIEPGAKDIPSVEEDTITYVMHKVKKGETVASIADDYMIDVEDIYFMNPGSEDGIEKRDKLKIPLQPVPKLEKLELDTSEKIIQKVSEQDNIYLDKLAFCDKLGSDREFHVALMIPLYLEEVDSIKLGEDTEIMPMQFYKSFRFLPFYQGMLLALDSLEKTGLKAKMFVYDITADTSKLQRILKNPEMKKLDLIIGLMYSSSFKIVSRFAKENDIIIVHPISNRDKIIINNPHVFKVMASLETQIKELAKYLVERYHDENILLVYNTSEEHKDNLALLEESIANCSKNYSIDCHYKSIACDRGEVKNIKRYLSDTAKNILVTLSTNQAFVINYLRQMNTVRDSFDIIVFGMPAWEKFKSLETKYLMNLKLHLFSNSFIDYTDCNVKKFIKLFREKYNAEPDEFAFQGFDIGYYFLSALKKYGKYYDDCIPLLRINSLQTEYYFHREGNNGFENSYINIYKYEDYQLKDAKKVTETTKVLEE